MSQSIAGISFEEIAKSMYLAYSWAQSPKLFGEPGLLEWDKLPRHSKIAWEAAARQAFFCNGLSGEHKAGDLKEQRWEQFMERQLSCRHCKKPWTNDHDLFEDHKFQYLTNHE